MPFQVILDVRFYPIFQDLLILFTKNNIKLERVSILIFGLTKGKQQTFLNLRLSY